MKKLIVCTTLFSFSILFSQAGVSSGSVSMLQSNGFSTRNEQGRAPERDIIVEDFMNYHRHKIVVPKEKDTQLSINYFESDNQNNEIILQVGLATKLLNNKKSKSRVNLGLVIDKSGSMSGDRITKVKMALKKLIEGLENGDVISITTFDNRSEVILPAQKINKDRAFILNTIDRITTGGSTNINDGMMLGYKEVAKNLEKNINSKLILLTDGMTNAGETNPEIIVNNSRNYNEKGIDISTIGVGSSLDFDLLRNLADAGRGSNHFIGDVEQDISKVFIDELQSLAYQITKDTEIEIQVPDQYKIKNFYGYQPIYLSENHIKIKLENLGYGVTQVFILKLEKLNDEHEPILVHLNYEKNEQRFTEKIQSKLHSKESNNDEVKKNYHIAMMAENLKKVANERQKSNFGFADEITQQTLSYIQKNANLNDNDIKRLYQIYCNCL